MTVNVSEDKNDKEKSILRAPPKVTDIHHSIHEVHSSLGA